ncbi:unnamed protein product [Prorocentrum cordatum]|uniref:Uncharacterized protein n=1 Tax=Prorocentrum cordatum TaxID=2364126 RepID=A0ABN9RPL5_9DINO|nr:unnamed protein product [Polarella glacialis]
MANPSPGLAKLDFDVAKFSRTTGPSIQYVVFLGGRVVPHARAAIRARAPFPFFRNGLHCARSARKSTSMLGGCRGQADAASGILCGWHGACRPRPSWVHCLLPPRPEPITRPAPQPDWLRRKRGRRRRTGGEEGRRRGRRRSRRGEQLWIAHVTPSCNSQAHRASGV